MTHAHDLGDSLHRQAVAVGHSDGCVAFLAEGVGGLLQRRFTPGVVLGEGGQDGSGLWGLAFRTGDAGIV